MDDGADNEVRGCDEGDTGRESSELVQGLRERDMERRLEAMGSIAGILEILPHIDMHADGSNPIVTNMAHDGTVEALVGLIRGDSGGSVLEVTSACQVSHRTSCGTAYVR